VHSTPARGEGWCTLTFQLRYQDSIADIIAIIGLSIPSVNTAICQERKVTAPILAEAGTVDFCEYYILLPVTVILYFSENN